MAGLHECPRCHYRFETAEALEQHNPDECTGGNNE